MVTTEVHMDRNTIMYYLITTSTFMSVQYMSLESWYLRPGWNFPRVEFATKTYTDSGYSIVIL